MSKGQEESEVYRLSQENMEQGRYYYEHSDSVYRENKLAENFIREMESLSGASIIKNTVTYCTQRI